MQRKTLVICTIVLVIGAGLSVTLLSVAQHAGPARKQELPIAEEDGWPLMEKVIRSYTTDSAIVQAGTIRLFDQKQPGNVLEQYDCIYYMQGQRVYSKIGPQENYYDKDMMISVDQDNKIMAVMPANEGMKSKNPFDLRALKKVLTSYGGRLTLLVEEGTNVLVFKNEVDADVKEYRMYVDPASFRITKVIMEMWKENAFTQDEPGTLTMQIDYNRVEVMNTFPTAFGKDRFLKTEGEKTVVQSSYEGFELYDQLN